MISNEAKRRAEEATVGLPDRSGQGVLVPGGLVLTAAHCIAFETTGGMALTGGDEYLERVKPRTGGAIRLRVVAVEPVADIAVLGAPDGQILHADASAFESFVAATTPVSLSADDFESETGVEVHVLTGDRAWVPGRAKRHGFGPPDGVAWIYAASRIERGTSGGPVVNEAGELVGLVSWSSGEVVSTNLELDRLESWDGKGESEAGGGGSSGRLARPYLALPCWALRHIAAAQGGKIARAVGGR